MTLVEQAIALHQRGQIAEAETLYRRALAANRRDFDALHMLGLVCAQQQNYVEAESLLREAIAVDPKFPPCRHNYGNVLVKLDRLEDAIVEYDAALAVADNYAPALSDRGNVQKALGRLDEALASYDKALTIHPKFADAHYNRAITLAKLTRFSDAIDSYDRAIALKPPYLPAQFNRAILDLLLGNCARGWDGYESRWMVANPPFTERSYYKPIWRGGENLAGQTIVLHAEQGLGDTIQFCRYARMVADRGAKVVLEVEPSLVNLLTSLDGVAQVVAAGDPLPPIGYHCALPSLPLAFRTTIETIPAAVPYLRPSSTHLEKWKAKLAGVAGPKICINWAGNPNFADDAERSILLPNLLPLLGRGDANFWAVQKDLRPGDAEILNATANVTALGQEIESFDDTAAIMALSDLVISSDTAVVHLAAALGRPVWVLLAQVPDWRWLIGRDDSPWYPTARLFRQTSRGDWAGVIDTVAGALAEFRPAG